MNVAGTIVGGAIGGFGGTIQTYGSATLDGVTLDFDLYGRSRNGHDRETCLAVRFSGGEHSTNVPDIWDPQRR